MEKIIPTGKVYVKQSAVVGAGRGVFASVAIQKGETIEVCPAIEISAHDVANLSESILVTYFFFYGGEKEKAYLALGFGSLYNHSHTPNASYSIHEKDMTIHFVAVSDITKDSEIRFDYTSGNPKNIDPLWFEV